MSIEITTNDVTGIVIWGPVFEDEILFDAAALTYAKGTLLGRITASGKLTKYTSGALDGSDVPVAVLRDAITLAAGVDKPCRPIISGRVRRQDLVAHGVGAITAAEADLLRTMTIIPLNTNELSELDNQ